MTIKQEVIALMEKEGITPGKWGHLQPTKYLAGMNALYRNRPDLCSGRKYVTARRAVIEHAKGVEG